MKKSFTQFITIIPLALLLSLTFSCQQQGEKGITEEEAKSIHDLYLEARNTVNLDLLDEIYAEDVVVHDCSYPEDLVGLDALKEYYSNNHKAFPDLNMTLDEMIVKGDRTVVVWTLSATNTGQLHTPLGDMPATGKKVQFSGVAIDRVDEGKIVEEWVYFNVLHLFQQLGFTLSPPQPSGTLPPVKAIGSIIPPKLIKEVEPVYPEKAKEAGVEGWVMLEATTDIYGRVKNVKVLKSIPLLDQAAIDAVRKYVYTPMIIDGRPRGVIHTVTVKFHLK